MGYEQIAEELNRRGMVTLTRKTFTAENVQQHKKSLKKTGSASCR